MKFLITTSLDFDKLNRKIDESTTAFDGFKSKPYVFMNEDTLIELANYASKHEIATNLSNKNIPQLHYANQTVFGKYYGCKVFMDNDLEYGEIELR